MIDPEFATSYKADKAPRVFAFKKDGMEDNYWEMIKNDVSFTIILPFVTLTYLIG